MTTAHHAGRARAAAAHELFDAEGVYLNTPGKSWPRDLTFLR